MEKENIISVVKDYLLDNFLFGFEEDEIKDNTSFMELGVLDSTGIMEIVSFLEDEYSITFGDDEIIPDNLDSLELIAKFVLNKIS